MFDASSSIFSWMAISRSVNLYLMILAGMPPTLAYGSISFVTTEPAPITAPFPIFTPLIIVAPCPINTSLPICVTTDSGLPEDCVVGDIIKIERKEEDKINLYFRVVV